MLNIMKFQNTKFYSFLLIIAAMLIASSAVAASDDIIIIPAAATVTINPGDNIQALIESHPAGTTFVLASGTHRMQSIIPRDGDSFIGQDGAILNGARLLTDFSREGSLWVVGGQTQQGERLTVSGWQLCRDESPRCNYAEDLYFDNVPLQHVSSKSQVSAGKWFFDYDADKIYFADDPTGHTVETSVLPFAFNGSNTIDNVTISNLTIEKYSPRAQRAAIYGEDTENWVLTNLTVQLNHGGGINLGNGMQVLNNRVIYNGQIGISGQGANILVEGNEIAYNNYAGYNETWEAGGTKFAKTDNLVIRSNYVHHNGGPGLWTDINNMNVLYENNLSEYNYRAGIFHEISYDAVIRNNVVRYNGTDGRQFMGQIFVSNSQNTEVYGNEVTVAEDYGDGIRISHKDDRIHMGEHGLWVAKNNYVHNNTIIYTGSMGRSGTVAINYSGEINLNDFWANYNNRFDYNTYYVTDPEYKHWDWGGGDNWGDAAQSWSGMHSFGQEQHGQVIYDVPPSIHDMTVSGDLSVSPANPIFTWSHYADPSDPEVPGEWYQLVVTHNDVVYLDQWYDAKAICAGVTCSVNPGLGLTQGGSYQWTVTSWTDAGGIGQNGSGSFRVNLVVPSAPTGTRVQTNQGRPSVIVPNDPEALWYQVWIGTESTLETQHLQWYEKTADMCSGSNCTILLDAYPTNGDYILYIRSWGEGGFNEGGVEGWTGPYDFTLSFNPPAVVVQMSVTANTNPQSTFTWNGSNGATWYQVWVGTPGPDFETYHLEWYNAYDLGCADGDMCNIPLALELPSGEYTWYVRAWGPGGYSEGGVEGWAQGTTFTR